MSAPTLLLRGPLRDEVAAFFEARAADVDAGQADVREGLAFVHDRVLADDEREPNGDLPRIAAAIATVAWSDLASAFSLWCHRMVIEYVTLAGPGTPLRKVTLPLLLRVERCGSTGLAAAMAHHVSGAPLPIEARREEDALFLDGRVRWASNLFVDDFVLVTAARDAVGGPPLIVALAAGSPGLRVDPYPELLALQATASSSLALEAVRVEDDAVVCEDFGAFIARVRPVFLVLQASFCWGLARRALDEAGRWISGQAVEVLLPELAEAEERAAALAGELAAAARAGPAAARVRELVRLRLESAHLATAAVALEIRAVGSRGYARGSGTARRLREAAFLPIQAPTEVQLRAELAGTRVPAAAR